MQAWLYMMRTRSSSQLGTQAWKFVRMRCAELSGDAARLENGQFFPSVGIFCGVSSLCVQPICSLVPGVSRALSVALSQLSDRYVAIAPMLTSRLVQRYGETAAGLQSRVMLS